MAEPRPLNPSLPWAGRDLAISLMAAHSPLNTWDVLLYAERAGCLQTAECRGFCCRTDSFAGVITEPA